MEKAEIEICESTPKGDRLCIKHDLYGSLCRAALGRGLAMMLAHARDSQIAARRALDESARYQRAAQAICGIARPELVKEEARAEVIGRLNWAASFFDREHWRDDVWPDDQREALADVRSVVQECEDVQSLIRWAVICERMPKDWPTVLMDDVLHGKPFDCPIVEV